MKYCSTPQHHGLGWVADLPDQRDHTYRPRVTAPVTFPDRIDLRDDFPAVYDQGQLGSCTAQALAANFDFIRGKQGQDFMHPSKLFIYWNERDMEGTVDSDAGATIRSGIKVLVKLGTPAERLWPYDIGKFTVQPPKKAYIEAEKNQALIYERIMRPANKPTHDMLLCLSSGIPFVTGFAVYESFESDKTTRTGMVDLPDSDEAMLGGHAVVVVGYDLPRETFICRNSWGSAWGDDGYFYMPFEYLANGALSGDQWLIRSVEV